MSADNWTQCPRCIETHNAELKRLSNEIDARYGKVSMEEFDEFRQEVQEFVLRGVDYQFREDYETFLGEDGWVHISYRGFCRTCSLAFKFEHDEKVVW